MPVVVVLLIVILVLLLAGSLIGLAFSLLWLDKFHHRVMDMPPISMAAA